MFYFISKISRSGYLNVQLSHNEMQHVLIHQETPEPCTWTNPGYLNIGETWGKTFKPYHDFKNNSGEDGWSKTIWYKGRARVKYCWHSIGHSLF